ncbi:sigma-70 family RNA polymerase sigma factor [Bacillus toyonensis]|uniref:sigma-70 family RNA polymerase sigma factor n=1 Tax=Bacillus toyonensis TaxID=155322 RepID=UPI0026F50C19|nr:sigma-70 family RNA polymerase sigma factor [Bacillus toyonensis]MDO8159146.1 sigma-70 family RNA polymerase sigma factor [Bacillus toyonensis]
MTPNELFEEKQHLVETVIKQKFKTIQKAEFVAKVNNMELNDLLQVGQLTLWEICLKKDLERIKNLDGYIVRAVKSNIIKEIHRKGKAIKLTSSVSWEERKKFQFASIDFEINGRTEQDFLAAPHINVEETVITSIQCHEAINKLKPIERLILVRNIHGFSDEEIAIEIGSNRGTVNQRRNRAIKKNHLLQQVI